MTTLPKRFTLYFQRREYELSSLIHMKADRRESLTGVLVFHLIFRIAQHIFCHIVLYLKIRKVRRLIVTASVIIIVRFPHLLT